MLCLEIDYLVSVCISTLLIQQRNAIETAEAGARSVCKL